MAARCDASADAFDDPRHDPSPHPLRSRCVHSPHCRLPRSYRARFGEPRGFWLHLGPIGRSTTPIVRHAVGDASRLTLGPVAGPTWPEHAGFDGFRLDLLCLLERPPFDARELVLPWAFASARPVWVAGKQAWRSHGGPVAIWYPPDIGLSVAGVAYRFGTDRPTAAHLAELGRGLDLIRGLNRRPGRPPRHVSDAWRVTAERAEQLGHEKPWLTRAAIAERVGTTERTLRTYAAELARERSGRPSSAARPPAPRPFDPREGA